MNTLKLILFIVLKDLIIWLSYFTLLKYNITGETYTDEMISAFPNADQMSIYAMIIGSIYISLAIILIDIFIVGFIYRIIKEKIIEGKVNMLVTGVFLNVPVVVMWCFIGAFELNKAILISFLISSIFAGLIFQLLSKNNKDVSDHLLDA